LKSYLFQMGFEGGELPSLSKATDVGDIPSWHLRALLLLIML